MTTNSNWEKWVYSMNSLYCKQWTLFESLEKQLKRNVHTKNNNNNQKGTTNCGTLRASLLSGTSVGVEIALSPRSDRALTAVWWSRAVWHGPKSSPLQSGFFFYWEAFSGVGGRHIHNSPPRPLEVRVMTVITYLCRQVILLTNFLPLAGLASPPPPPPTLKATSNPPA